MFICNLFSDPRPVLSPRLVPSLRPGLGLDPGLVDPGLDPGRGPPPEQVRPVGPVVGAPVPARERFVTLHDILIDAKF